MFFKPKIIDFSSWKQSIQYKQTTTNGMGVESVEQY